jgi:DNA-binding transcriptional MerR regulator
MKPILTAEAARLIGVTPAAVRAMEKRGDLPAERTSNDVRLFDRTVVERFARARSHQRRAADRDSSAGA